MPKTQDHEIVILPHFKPEEVEALRQEHERRKAVARPTLNADDERIRDAIQREMFWRSQPESEHRTEELAHCLFTQGRIDEALELSVNPERRAYYESIKSAIQKDDDKFCDCPESENVTIEGKKSKSVFWHTIGYFPSPKHGGRLTAIQRCVCGDMNITP